MRAASLTLLSRTNLTKPSHSHHLLRKDELTGKAPASSSSTELFLAAHGRKGIVFFSQMKDASLRFLSNFFPLQPPILLSSSSSSSTPLSYPTVEHFFQAEKARLLGFPDYAEAIRLVPVQDAAKVKAMGGAKGPSSPFLSSFSPPSTRAFLLLLHRPLLFILS